METLKFMAVLELDARVAMGSAYPAWRTGSIGSRAITGLSDFYIKSCQQQAKSSTISRCPLFHSGSKLFRR